ncbi:MAG: rhodanese-like domain-containing protein [Pseudomonadota bacterium]
MIGRTSIIVFAALGLAACTPSDEEDRDQNPNFGFELAVASEGPDANAPSQVIDLSVEQLRAKLDAGDIRLIDVRTEAEVAEGMLPNAEHIALDSFDPASLDTSDSREIVLYCRSGRRSARAGEMLAAHTGKPVQHLAGGIIAWREAGELTTAD